MSNTKNPIPNGGNRTKKENSIPNGPVRMPWLHLLNPVTGELPKNYKSILAKEEEERKRKAELSKSSTTVPNTPLEDNRAGISYFLNPQSLSNDKLSSKSSNIKSRNNTVLRHRTPLTPRLGIDKASKEGLSGTKTLPDKLIKKKLFTSSPYVKKILKDNKNTFENTSHSIIDSPNMGFKYILTSPNGSTEEFMETEEQLGSLKCASDDLNKSRCSIYDIFIERFTNMIEKQNQVLEDMKQLLDDLKMVRDKYNKKGDNKENIPTNKNDLKRNLTKKNVSFDDNVKENVEKAMHLYNSMKLSSNVLQTPISKTPRTMKRHLSEKVYLQCLMLQNTPKQN